MRISRGLTPPTVFILTTFLYVVAFPPLDGAEAAYLFAVPLLVWIFFRPRLKTFFFTSLASSFVAWVILLSWLRHVTWEGTVFLAFILGCVLALWFLTAWWAVPRLVERSFPVRLLGVLGLAGLWVLLEWIRSFAFSGFPWLPLAASQWERPVLLQLAAWTGAYGVSFLLIFFNLAIAFYLRHLVVHRKEKGWASRFCPEFYIALGLLLGTIGLFLKTLPRATDREPFFTAGIVQPYIEQLLKWDAEEAQNNLDILAQQTTFVELLNPDLILWPESATPWPIKGDAAMRMWAERFVDELGKPVLMGNYSHEGDILHNGIFIVNPKGGLSDNYYIKRKLVPFGEYIPLRRFLPFIEKFVPIAGDFTPGEDASSLSVEINGKVFRCGSMVCYEDVFPHLARESAAVGIDFLFVATNNAWYGEEGGAYQHAAHSVLRAVETRRLVVRCGNGGWSGWIDEYGRVRHVLTDQRGSIYFRGGELVRMDRDPKWIGRHSFYVRYGDWFVAVCAGFSLIGFLIASKNGSAKQPVVKN